MVSRAARIGLLLLALFGIAVGVDGLMRPLGNPDEGRYSEISREMAATGDWITPRLDGIKYFEKPPLQYWATAGIFRVLGEGEFTARLYVAMCAIGTLLLAAYTARRLGTPAERDGTIFALLASPYFMALGTIVTLDMGLTFWTTAAVCAFVLAEQAAQRNSRSAVGWIAFAWAATAFAVLSKGPVGIVFAGALVFFHCVLQRDFSALKRLGWWYGLPLFLAIAVPWFVAVSRANPEFASFFFIHEHVDRFLTNEARRVQPWWFFLPIVALGFLPWTFALPAAIRAAWTSEAGQRFQPLRVGLLWCVFVIAFFSASGSKLPTYVLPVFPILGIVLGRYLATAPTQRLAWCAGLGALLVLPLGIFAWNVANGHHDAWREDLYRDARPWALTMAATYLAGAVAGAVLLRRGRRWTGIAALTFCALFAMDCLEDAYEALSPLQSGLQVSTEMKPWLKPDTRLYSVHHYDQTLPFYIGRTMMLVDYGDEFEMGLISEPWRSITYAADFPEQWLRPGDAMAIMQPDSFKTFQRQGLPMQVLHQDPRRVLVRKP